MRILLTVASLHPETGGPARSVPGLATALAHQGVDVHVWSPNVPDLLPEPVGFVLHRGTLEATLDLVKRLDLIHDNGLWLPLNHRIAKAAMLRGIPRVVSPRGMLEPWALKHKKWKKRLAWLFYQKYDLETASLLHSTAESEAEQFVRLGLTCAVTTIPNGVEILGTPKFKNATICEERKSYDDVRYATCSPTRTALFLSRIHPKKGLPLLVDTWAKVRPAGWRMLVAGPDEGGHRAKVEMLVRHAGLSGEWEFCGSLEGSKKRSAYENADLFILPTYSENFGIAVAEALAHGLPVITTHGAPWQLLESERCGWWVPANGNGIASALDDATRRSPEELAAMGERGRTVVAERFVWDGIAKQFFECYQWLLGRGPKPGSVR
jgi:glycosyltransferase involved in cell wall biosynthesis